VHVVIFFPDVQKHLVYVINAAYLSRNERIDIRLYRLVEFPYPAAYARVVDFRSLRLQMFSDFPKRNALEVEVYGIAYRSRACFGIFKCGIKGKPVAAILAKVRLNVASFLVVSHTPFFMILTAASLADYLADLVCINDVLVNRRLDQVVLVDLFS